jgi:solute carrier family 35
MGVQANNSAAPSRALFGRGANAPGADYTPRQVALSLTFFGGSSLGAIFANKACLTHYNFGFPFALMLFQVLATVTVITLLSVFLPQQFALSPVKRHHWTRLIAPSLLFVANVSVGLSALSHVNIPMFSAFRRLTVLFVMMAEFVVLRQGHSRRVVGAVCVLATGSFISALGDVTFSSLGYALVFANNILTAVYLASIKRVMSDLQIDPLSLNYYVSCAALFLVSILCAATGDLKDAFEAYHARPDLHDSTLFVPSLAFVAFSSICVNLSTSLCTHVTSPLTTSVVGQVKNVVQTVLGFFSWGYIPTPLNVSGLLVALGGQIAFAYFKHRESQYLALAMDDPYEDESPKRRDIELNDDGSPVSTNEAAVVEETTTLSASSHALSRRVDACDSPRLSSSNLPRLGSSALLSRSSSAICHR